MSFSDLKLFALSSNRELAERVAQEIASSSWFGS